MKNSSHRSLFATAATAAIVAAFGLCPLALQAQAVAPPPALSSQPVLAEEDILDIRGPIHIPAAFPWLTPTAGVLGALAFGCGFWALSRRPRRKLPYEIALGKLEATRALMHEGNAEPFSLAVSEVVRLFIEESMPVRAAHRTTNEFLHDLVHLPESPMEAHREFLGQFLGHCDLAKFARWSLTVPQMETMLASAGLFVTAIGKPAPGKSRPAPAVPTSAAIPRPVTTHS